MPLKHNMDTRHVMDKGTHQILKFLGRGHGIYMYGSHILYSYQNEKR